MCLWGRKRRTWWYIFFIENLQIYVFRVWFMHSMETTRSNDVEGLHRYTSFKDSIYFCIYFTPSVYRLSPTQFFSSSFVVIWDGIISQWIWVMKTKSAFTSTLFYVVLSKFNIWRYIFNSFPLNAMKDKRWCWIGLECAVDSVECYHRKTNWMRMIGQLSEYESACRSLLGKWHCFFSLFY